jgi:hypothetical protein
MQVESESCEQVPEFCLQNTVPPGSFPSLSSEEQAKKVNVMTAKTVSIK